MDDCTFPQSASVVVSDTDMTLVSPHLHLPLHCLLTSQALEHKLCLSLNQTNTQKKFKISGHNYLPKCGFRSRYLRLCWSTNLWNFCKHGACCCLATECIFNKHLCMSSRLGAVPEAAGTTFLSNAWLKSSLILLSAGDDSIEPWRLSWRVDEVLNNEPERTAGDCEICAWGEEGTLGVCVVLPVWGGGRQGRGRVEDKREEVLRWFGKAGSTLWSCCFCLWFRDWLSWGFFRNVPLDLKKMSPVQKVKGSEGSRQAREGGGDGGKSSSPLWVFKARDGTVMLRAKDSIVSCFFFRSFLGRMPITWRWLLQYLQDKQVIFTVFFKQAHSLNIW